jgi:aspartate-semialdehyde dehydrogenase
MTTFDHETNGLDVAIVGVTGAVGREMLSILEEREFPMSSLRGMASASSSGRELPVAGDTVTVEALGDASFEDVDLAFFTAGSSVSHEHAPRALKAGTRVVDNTSAFRMDPSVPLVVPEVNGDVLEDVAEPRIVANPNCSTTQMVVALEPLAEVAGLDRVVVSTYQSASGAGQRGTDELLEELRAWAEGRELEEDERVAFPHPIAFETIPHIGSFDEEGWTSEEIKMVEETRKIMDRPELSVASHCVRVPTIRSHSESLTVDLEEPLPVERARDVWQNAPGVTVRDTPESSEYPLARHAAGTDDTWVGRLRRDLERPETLHFWVVSDNLRKGAALNSIQIAEHFVEQGSPT